MSRGTYCFGPFPPPPLPPPFCQHFSTFRENFFKPPMINLWVWEKFVGPISVTFDQGHQATEARRILTCPHSKVRNAHPNAKHFFVIFQMRFSPTQRSICQSNVLFAIYLEWLVQLMWNTMEISQLDASLSRVPLSLSFDLEFSRTNCISGIGLQCQIWSFYLGKNGSIVTKQKQNISIER